MASRGLRQMVRRSSESSIVGRGVQIEPPLPVDFLAACFTVSDAGVLVWKRRPAEHFPERPEDAANFNARFEGKAAGFTLGGQTVVRLQYRGRRRRMAALRVAWAISAGSYPVGVIEPRNGDPSDLRPENLIERSRGRNKFGGVSKRRSLESDRALVAALAEAPAGASIAQISRLVGSDKPCTCRRLAKLVEAGLTCGPMCVPSRHWHLTGAGAALASSAKPPVDDLDQDILRVISQRDHIAAASIARRVERTEMTARRRLRTLVERGLVVNGDGWTITACRSATRRWRSCAARWRRAARTRTCSRPTCRVRRCRTRRWCW